MRLTDGVMFTKVRVMSEGLTPPQINTAEAASSQKVNWKRVGWITITVIIIIIVIAAFWWFFLRPKEQPMTTEQVVPCDMDRDGSCDQDDISIFRKALNNCTGDRYYNELADADHDGCVTETDRKQLFPSAKPATPSAKKDETEGWKTYTNASDGYSIKYPNDWFYNDAARYSTEGCEPGLVIDQGVTIFGSKNLKCEGFFILSPQLPAEFVVIANGEEYDLDQLERGDLSDNPAVNNYSKVLVDGESAIRRFQTATSEGPRCTCTSIFVNHKGKGYLIQFLNKDFSSNHKPIYDQILSTFQFID